MRSFGLGLLVLLVACSGGEDLDLELRLMYETNDGASAPPDFEGWGCKSGTSGGACLQVRLQICAEGSPCENALPEAAESFPVDLKDRQALLLPTTDASRSDLHLWVGLYESPDDPEADDVLIASGQWRGASLRERPDLLMTLAPVLAGTACGEPGDAPSDSDTGLHLEHPRAFHTATLLPDDDVLVIGGLGGQSIELGGDGNSLEPAIEVFHPRTGEFGAVTVVNQVAEESPEELSRAFHRAFYVGERDGRHVVRVVGGIHSIGVDKVAFVSRTRGDTPLQMLVVGTAEAEAAPAVDVVYDSSTSPPTATIQKIEGAPTGSFMVATALPDRVGAEEAPGGATGGFLFGGGLAGGAGPWGQNRLCLTPQCLPAALTLIGPDGAVTGDPSALAIGRVGATAVPIGPDEVLIWGGNVGSGADAQNDVDAEIGEFHTRSGASGVVEITAPPEMELTSPAFHAAAVASAQGQVYRIVVAGGYRVNDIGTVHVSEFASPPIYLLTYDRTTHTATVSDVQCYESEEAQAPGDCAVLFDDVAYLTATTISDGRVFLAGGNFIAPGSGGDSSGFKFAARAIGGVVVVEGDTASFRPRRLAFPRYGHTATTLADGSILLLGGLDVECVTPGSECGEFNAPRLLANYELYNEGEDFAPTVDCDQEPLTE
ncbi:MAG: hypothetical protein HYY06_21190 [Deltaproteobacteria bacterium]|nr:hypothetical protein [Deltaproteobacteria bacterium]